MVKCAICGREVSKDNAKYFHIFDRWECEECYNRKLEETTDKIVSDWGMKKNES